jgi:hypothetical protein
VASRLSADRNSEIAWDYLYFAMTCDFAARSQEAQGKKEKERKDRKSSDLFFFFLFLFSDWIRCIPPSPFPERGRVAQKSP